MPIAGLDINKLRTLLNRTVLGVFALVALAGPAHAQSAGYRTLTIPGDTPLTVALFYPTSVPDRVVTMGPWLPIVAPGAPASDRKLNGLILIVSVTSRPHCPSGRQ